MHKCTRVLRDYHALSKQIANVAQLVCRYGIHCDCEPGLRENMAKVSMKSKGVWFNGVLEAPDGIKDCNH